MVFRPAPLEAGQGHGHGVMKEEKSVGKAEGYGGEELGNLGTYEVIESKFDLNLLEERKDFISSRMKL